MTAGQRREGARHEAHKIETGAKSQKHKRTVAAGAKKTQTKIQPGETTVAKPEYTNTQI